MQYKKSIRIGSDNVKPQMSKISGDEELKPFRLTAKNLFLTYSQTLLSKEEAINQLKEILFNKIDEYIVSQENHQDGGFHLHVYLKLNTKINILSSNKLDLKDSKGNIIHGQYQSARNIFNVINYVKKSGDFISNVFDAEEFNKTLYKLADEFGIDYAMNYFCEQKPEWVCTRYKNIRSNLQSYLSNKNKKLIAKFKKEEYSYPEDIIEWYDKDKHKKTLVIVGKSGIGKTEAIISLLERYNPLLIKDLNGLKNLKDEHLALIMDDISWKDVSREMKINLFDKDRFSDIRILYNCISLSPDLIKVVITNFDKNIDDILFNHDFNFIQRQEAVEAIKRRIKKVILEKPLFNLKINTNITINKMVINNNN